MLIPSKTKTDRRLFERIKEIEVENKVMHVSKISFSMIYPCFLDSMNDW